MNKDVAINVMFTSSTSMMRNQSPLRLAVIGIGALGSEVCLHMEEALRQEPHPSRPIAEIHLIDPDRLESRNLGLSRLLRPAGAGRFKADLAAESLNTDGFLRWTAIPCEIADVGWQILKSCDLLISCVDSALARSEIALVARRLHLPMLDGGVSAEGAAHGRIAWFPPTPESACYLCGIGEAHRAEILAYGFARTLGCSVPRDADPLSEQLTAAPAVRETASAMVRAIMHFAWDGETGFLDPKQASAERLTASGEAGRAWATERLNLPRSAICPWHEEQGEPLVSIEEGQTFREGIPQSGGTGTPWRIQLAWPICLEARCRGCGLQQECAQRLAKLRRRGICIGCGMIGTLEPLRSIGSLGSEDFAAGRTPVQLGLPERHLYRLRRTMALASEEENRS